MALYGFITDKALIDPSQRLVNLETLAIPCGFLDREMIESFVEPLEISDRRSTRLPIEYRSETLADISPLILNDLITNISALGMQHLLIAPGETVTLGEYLDLNTLVLEDDVLPVVPVSLSRSFDFRLTFDNSKLTAAEISALSTMSQDDVNRLMNVVEYISYGTLTGDQLVDINSYLVDHPALFGGYLSTSVRRLNGVSIVRLYDDVNIHRIVPKSFSFNFIAGGENLSFTLWLDRDNFKATYPLYTISLIVPPLPLPILLDPSSITDPLIAVQSSKAFSNALVGPEIINNDQSGMVVFTTRYIWNGTTHMLSFEIMYRGRCPNALELRLALADYLLNSGYGSRAIWELRFPDIFIENQFYIVPFYDEITVLSNSDIYRSTIDVNIVTSKFRRILAGLRVVPNMMELMTVAYDKLFLGVSSDTINLINSMIELHPGYRDFSSTDIGFAEMNTEDREWSILFNQALAIASGELNDSTAQRITISGREFVCMIRNRTAYNILTRESYSVYVNL